MTRYDGITAQALVASREKWVAILNGTGTDKGIVNCPLCQRFGPTSCVLEEIPSRPKCPVFEDTGAKDCDNSPYRAWADHQEKCHLKQMENKIHCPECRRLAKLELEYLSRLIGSWIARHR